MPEKKLLLQVRVEGLVLLLPVSLQRRVLLVPSARVVAIVSTLLERLLELMVVMCMRKSAMYQIRKIL